MFARNAERERGVAVPTVALSLVVLIVAASFTIDLGRVMNRGRDMQLVADIAALDASRLLDGRAANEQQPVLESAVARSAERNRFGDTESRTFTVRLGSVDSDGRFDPVANPSTDVPTAVQVTASDDVPFILGPGGRTATRTATATSTATARIEVGSGLLGDQGSCNGSGLTPASTLNGALGSLLGASLSVDAISYQGLACTHTTLGDLTTAVGFGTDVDSLLAMELTVDELLNVMIDAVEAQRGSSQASGALVALEALVGPAANAAGLGRVSLGDLVAVTGNSGDTPSRYADVPISLGALVQGAIYLGRDGAVVSVPGMNVAVPGLLSLTVDLGIVEPPQVRIGPLGSTVSTAQVRLRIAADVVQIPGVGTVHLPLLIEAGAAEATLLGVQCLAGSPTGADMRVDTASARMMVGTMPNGALVSAADAAPTAAPLVSLLGIPVVLGATTVSLAGTSERVHVDAGEFGSRLRVHGATSSSTAGSLLVAGLPVTSLVLGVLAPVIESLLADLVTPLLDGLGVQLAYADVAVHDPTCPTPRLVS